MPGLSFSPTIFLFLSLMILDQQTDNQEGDDVQDFDHRVNRRAGRIFVGIADSVASYRRFVSFGAFAAEVS